jgi:glycosyltransferase involved in cell wall biosynthesis
MRLPDQPQAHEIQMRIVALLAVRNEELYLARCLRHLFAQGVEVCVIDNDSTDRTRQIAEGFFGRGVFRIEKLPFYGYFDLLAQLRAKEQLAHDIDADWFIHHDADEIREAPAPFKTLRDAINAADAEGYTAIDFDEFVFLPTALDENFENTNYVERIRFYYFFAPRPRHRVNAWKKTDTKVNLMETAGHEVQFEGRWLSPIPFTLRHYIILSAAHARKKYGTERVYSKYEVEELGWHRTRTPWTEGEVKLPPCSALKQLDATGLFDRSDPRPVHLFSFERTP